ncbi:LysR family transcriptional regulator [Arthrobacter woluwensis]|uniref:LysR family transcriptional regulator n=1 Tax=Arthrobacter woluwensis TaxID=156980 RepID=UPI003800FA00
MRILPTSLQYFYEVARSGTIVVAAETLHVSSSAISRQIATLERQLGVALFTRHARGMELSPAGRMLLSHVRRTELEGAALLEELQTLENPRRRVLRVTSCEGLARKRVPEALALFQKEHPDVDVELTVLASALSTHRLLEGEADVAAVYAIAPPHEVRVLGSFPAPAHAILPRRSPAAETFGPIGLSELCGLPLALSSRGITQRELFDIAVRMDHLEPRIALETDHVSPLMEFVRSGAGATLLSHFTVDPLADDYAVLRSIDHPVLGQRQAQVQLPLGPGGRTWAEAFGRHLSDILAQCPPPTTAS